MSIKAYDQSIAKIREPVGDKDIDQILELIAQIVESLKEDYTSVFSELMTMYESASEHNVDVSRMAVYNLARRMLAPEQRRAPDQEKE